MCILNLKRLTVRELNDLAASIIDELSLRPEPSEEQSEDEEIMTRLIKGDMKQELLIEERNRLYDQQELIDDEIERICEELAKLERVEDALVHELNIS